MDAIIENVILFFVFLVALIKGAGINIKINKGIFRPKDKPKVLTMLTGWVMLKFIVFLFAFFLITPGVGFIIVALLWFFTLYYVIMRMPAGAMMAIVLVLYELFSAVRLGEELRLLTLALNFWILYLAYKEYKQLMDEKEIDQSKEKTGIKIKNIVIASLAVMVVFIALWQLGLFDPPTTADVPDGFLLYTGLPAATIAYPEDWTFVEGYMGTNVLFSSPRKNDSDTFQENINIIIRDLSTQPMTLDQYTEANINQLSQIITDFEIIGSGKTTIADSPAQGIVATGRQGQYYLTWMQVWTIKNNRAYVITYTAEDDEYNNYFDDAQVVLDSFEWV